MKIVLGVVEWTIAILAVGGTAALFIWLAVLFFRKDDRNDTTGNRH